MSKAKTERNKLIVELKDEQKMSYRQISEYLEENGWGRIAPPNVVRNYYRAKGRTK